MNKISIIENKNNFVISNGPSNDDLWRCMLNDQDFTDVEFKVVTSNCKFESIKAHRIVLASSSDYFKKLFTNGMQESNNGVIEVSDVSPDVLRTLIQFCYAQQVVVKKPMSDEEMDHFIQLVQLADKFLLSELKKTCEEVLIRLTNEHTAIAHYIIAQDLFGIGCPLEVATSKCLLYSLLVHASDDEIQSQFGVIRSTMFMLSKKHLFKLINTLHSSSSWSCTMEYNLVLLSLAWLEAKPNETFDEVWNVISIEHLSSEQLCSLYARVCSQKLELESRLGAKWKDLMLNAFFACAVKRQQHSANPPKVSSGNNRMASPSRLVGSKAPK